MGKFRSTLSGVVGFGLALEAVAIGAVFGPFAPRLGLADLAAPHRQVETFRVREDLLEAGVQAAGAAGGTRSLLREFGADHPFVERVSCRAGVKMRPHGNILVLKHGA